MESISLATSPNPVVHLNVNGNTHCKGWEKDEILVQANAAEAVNLVEEDGVVHLTSERDTVITLPASADLRVGTVHGNGQFKDLAGTLTIQKIGGNLDLRQTGPSVIDKIYGNLTARDISGDLELNAIYGNLSAQRVAGRVQVHEQAKGNLVLREVSGAYAMALGNATLNFRPSDSEEYLVEVSGNIHCTVPAEASVEIEASSGSHHIRIDFPERKDTERSQDLTLTRHGGDSRVTLKAKGFIHLATGMAAGDKSGHLPPDFGDNFGEISEEINSLINDQMQALEQQLNESLSSMPDFSESSEFSNDINQIVEQARQYSTRAALHAQTRAQAAAQRAQEKLARKLEKARRKSERSASRGGARRAPSGEWVRGRASRRSRPADDPVSDEERLLILKMLEEKQISLEEAEQLLTALEGKAD
jgi:DUF4097 and DUF4098 domain-containing protein YvlB